MSGRSLALGCLLAALAAAGCAAPEAPPVAKALAAAPPREKVAPCALRLAVAPVEVASDAACGPANEGEFWGPVPVDVRDIGDAVKAAVVASGAFAPESVDVLPLARPLAPAATPTALVALASPVGLAADDAKPGDAKGAGAKPAAEKLGPPLFRTPREVPLADVFAKAFERRDDLVLTVRVKRHAVEFAGHNGWFAPNIVNFALWIWPAWFVPDETYVARVEMEAELRAVGSEAVLRRFPLEGRFESDLDHFDRGWKIAGTLTVPGGLPLIGGELGLENWRAAGEHLLPFARNACAVSLAADLVGLRKSEGPDFQKGLEKTLAVVAGCARYRSVPDLRTATDDAERVRELLSDAARGGVPARNVKTLVEAQATKAAILDAVRERASRGREGDTLVVYLSCFGFAAGGEVYLAPTDLAPASPTASAISLAELGEALRGPARAAVILDACFGGESRPGAALRTLSRETLTGLAGAPAAADEEVRDALERFAKGRVVIAAAAPGSAAAELSPRATTDKKSLLAACLLDAVAAPATDTDKDGAVSVAEAFEALKRDVPRLSARAGVAQVPLLLGAEADAKATRLAKTAAAPAAKR